MVQKMMIQSKLLSDPTVSYLSLALCILTPMTIDQALETIAPDPDADRKMIRRQEDEDMIRLRGDEYKMSWYGIGQMFGISPMAAFKRVKYFKGKAAGE
jgi:hypothetical protein